MNFNAASVLRVGWYSVFLELCKGSQYVIATRIWDIFLPNIEIEGMIGQIFIEFSRLLLSGSSTVK